MDEKPEKKAVAEVWKWIAAILGASLVSAFLGNAAALLAQPNPMTEEDTRRVLREELEESFTETSRTRGMYVIEGRPKIKALEDRAEAGDARDNAQERMDQTILRTLDRLETQVEALRNHLDRMKK